MCRLPHPHLNLTLGGQIGVLATGSPSPDLQRDVEVDTGGFQSAPPAEEKRKRRH